MSTLRIACINEMCISDFGFRISREMSLSSVPDVSVAKQPPAILRRLPLMCCKHLCRALIVASCLTSASRSEADENRPPEKPVQTQSTGHDTTLPGSAAILFDHDSDGAVYPFLFSLNQQSANPTQPQVLS